MNIRLFILSAKCFFAETVLSVYLSMIDSSIDLNLVMMQEENFSRSYNMDSTTQESQDIDKTALFLELIQNYTFLYDLSHKDYKDNEKKNNAWRSIGDAMGWSAEQCQKHWKSLRDKYTRLKRDTPRSGSEATEGVKWHYFTLMSFYEKCTKPRKTYSSVMSQNSSGTTTPVSVLSPSGEGHSEWDTLHTITSPENIQTEMQSKGLESTLETPKSIERLDITPSKYKKGVGKKAREETQSNEIIDLAKNIHSTMQKATQNIDNPNWTFAKYLYSELQCLTAEEAKAKRAKILELFLK